MICGWPFAEQCDSDPAGKAQTFANWQYGAVERSSLPSQAGIEMSSGPASQVSLKGDSLFSVLQGLGETLGPPRSAERPTPAAERRPLSFVDDGEYVTLPKSTTAQGIWPPISPLAAVSFRTEQTTGLQWTGDTEYEQHIPRPTTHTVEADVEKNGTRKPRGAKYTNLGIVQGGQASPAPNVPTSSSPVKTHHQFRVESGRTSRWNVADNAPQISQSVWERVPLNVTTTMPKASAVTLTSARRAVPSATRPLQEDGSFKENVVDSCNEGQDSPSRHSPTVKSGQQSAPCMVRSEKVESLMEQYQKILQAKPHTFLCADGVEHAECRENGKLPKIRLSCTSRGPCLLLGLDGGHYGWSKRDQAKVVCNVTLGHQTFRTLATEIRADGTWSTDGVFALPLDARQVQNLKMQTPQDGERSEHILIISVVELNCETGGITQLGSTALELKVLVDLANQSSNSGGRTNTKADLADDRGNLQKAQIFLSALWGQPAGISWAPQCLEDIVKTTDEAALAAGIVDHEIQCTKDKVSSGKGDESEESDEDDEEQSEDMHWRERLERLVDSLALNILVMLLVMLDIILAIVFEFSAHDTASSGDSLEIRAEITVIQALILFLFGKF